MARDMSTIEEAINPSVAEQPAPQSDNSVLLVGADPILGQKKRKPRTKKVKPPEEQIPEGKTDENQPPTPAPEQPAPEQSPAMQNAMQQFFQSARGILRDVGVRLENVPTPGSITLPLILLLVFFFFLVPVNGSTRFTWLWLVISGDASTSGGQGNVSGPANNGSHVPGSSGAAGGGTSGANAFPIPSTAGTMTGVEDL